MSTAKDLKPGDVYAASDRVRHTVETVNHLSHRSTVIHTDGTERVLFASAYVEVLS